MNAIIERLLLVLFAAALMALATTGCKNTAEGVGEDMEEVGEDIQREVD